SANEPNLTIFIPETFHNEKTVACTYITVAQVPKTRAVLLVKPSWMWGAEMGINDGGVVIGNEAVFTKSSGKKENRLIGMDMLRLALERAGDAKEALDILVSLLETYGQGGNCGFDKPFYYDNSFLIGDAKTAFILETAGKTWTMKPIEDYGNISNRLTLHSNNLDGSALIKDFAKRQTEPIFTFFSRSKHRQNCVFSNLNNEGTSISSIMDLLRSHDPKDALKLYEKGSIGSVCMHQSLIGDHTTGSMIVEQRKNHATIWLTGCGTPCLSVYKSTFFGETVAPVFTNESESLAYWLDREYLVRAIYAKLINVDEYQKQLQALQNQLIDEEAKLYSQNPNLKTLAAFSKRASQAEQEFVEGYRDQIESIRKDFSGLPKIWRKKTEKLGKNVFSKDLNDRISK
ncbi:MAG TPA: hypothetical protein DD618_03420, partial [Acholeplasmatales bacterium]|nr:hypothetical protein [Acholeplasmatales bacterium]